MAKLVSAYVIYDGTTSAFVDDGSTVILNCDKIKLGSPRRVWLQRSLLAGDGTDIRPQPTFSAPTSVDIVAYGTNLLQGLWIEQDEKVVMIDVASIQTVLDACNGCCDDSVPVPLPRFYTDGIPAFTYPAASTYCITRMDNGSPEAHSQVELDYGVSQGATTFRLRSNISGVSKYEVTSYSPLLAMPGDTIAAGVCS